VCSSGACAVVSGANCCTPLERPGWLNKRARMRSPLPLSLPPLNPDCSEDDDAAAAAACAAGAQKQGEGGQPLLLPLRGGAQHSLYGALHSMCDSSDGEEGMQPERDDWQQSPLGVCDGSDDGQAQDGYEGYGGALGLNWDAACIFTQDMQHQDGRSGAGNGHESTFEGVLRAVGGPCHEPEIIEID